MSKLCSSCNAENVDEAKFCRKCGTSQFDSENKINKQNNQRSYADVASVNDDEIYERALLEIEQDRKVKSAWARALSQADGDLSKTEALYIQLRVKAVKDEADAEYQIKYEEDNKEKEKKLQLFIKKYNLQIDRKISETKYLTSNGSITWFKEAKYWRFY